MLSVNGSLGSTDKSTRAIERYYCQDSLHTVVIRNPEAATDHNFVNPNEDPLQVGLLRYQAGAEVKRHHHPPVRRVIDETLEVLFVTRGSGGLELFDLDGHSIAKCRFQTGDTIFFLRGGHALAFDKETVVIQVKGGPYVGPELDKLYY